MKRRLASHRRGMAIILVMTMISIAMAVSYAMMRTQATTVQVQANSERRGQARNAAMAGLAAGLRRMHSSAWEGVNTTLLGTLGNLDSYSVQFTPGDSTLAPSDPDYMLAHLRVTLVSTGISVSQANSQVSSRFTVKAVVQLVPRQLGAEPVGWSNVRNFTLYQTGTGQFSMAVPGQVQGPVRLQGEVALAEDLNWSDSATTRYFSDLNVMRTARNEIQSVAVNNATGGQFRLQFSGATTSNLNYNASAASVQSALRALATIGSGNVSVAGNNGGPWTVTFVNGLASQNVSQIVAMNVSLSGGSASVSTDLITQGSGGYPDCRPLTGPVSLPTSATDATNLALLGSLGVTTNNINVSNAMSLPLPSTLASYRIYTGGPTYSVPQVSANLISTTLAPDPVTNPLGIYFCPSSMTVCNNVSVAGTLIGGTSITVCGHNVNFVPLNLWPLAGSSTPVRLPAMVARQTVRTDTTLSATVNGFVIAGQQFLFDVGSRSASFALNGRLVTNEFVLRRRNEWNLPANTWGWLFSWFNQQLGATNTTPFYPIYLAYWAFNPNPALTIRPDTSEVTEHWQDLTTPIYVRHPDDPGLRWDVLSITMDE